MSERDNKLLALGERAISALHEAITEPREGQSALAVERIIELVDARARPPLTREAIRERAALTRDALAFIELCRDKFRSSPENLTVLEFIDAALLAYADPERKR